MEISPLLHPARSEKVKSWSCWSPVGSEIESSRNCDDDEFARIFSRILTRNPQRIFMSASLKLVFINKISPAERKHSFRAAL